ncbi:hypothetical protein BCR36DRAFT_468830 [Piromyces finnis]|uniref:Coth-domain-containing protein n=1 Tax=Piromyces finnis TaxID=1754191 RepID=A0A1Y1VGG1_9FUNG|nr:hypothetical protein BCR36DRAFT_468830 [Piromyces finnis]|eukprot:ORX55514.1 hypothetical protein BCR36DRAFT_468830 [Piromyces finnis]
MIELFFNLKLKGDDLLLGRKHIRVRSDAEDNTHMKSKIAYDLLNKWNIPSIQETYCELYINEEYFGLYFLLDTIKSNWIIKTYNLPTDEEVETLFYCKNTHTRFINGDECYNDNDKTANYTKPFENFIEKIKASESIDDIKKFMNIDLLMKNLAIEFLFGSHDHFILTGHNFYMYQRKDGIWDMILVDFDSDLGSSLYAYFLYALKINIDEYGYRLKLEDMLRSENRLIDIVYTKDKTAFKKALREIMITGFNPDALFKRIEELKEFIAPYVKKTTTPRPDGRLPGVINFKGSNNHHTYEDFEAVSRLENTSPVVPSLKSWIKNRFEFACEEYGLDKEEILREAAKFRGEILDEPENEKEDLFQNNEVEIDNESRISVSIEEITETENDDLENEYLDDKEMEVTGEIDDLENEYLDDKEMEVTGEIENAEDLDDEEYDDLENTEEDEEVEIEINEEIEDAEDSADEE